MTFPKDEAETIQLFKLASARLGWHLAHLQAAFPDAVIENGRGARLVVEFEYEARNFQQHGHDPIGCDLIICWSSRWENPPMPVWELRKCAQEEARIVNRLLRDRQPRWIAIEQVEERLALANERIEELEIAIEKWLPLAYGNWVTSLRDWVADNLLLVYFGAQFIGIWIIVCLIVLLGRMG